MTAGLLRCQQNLATASEGARTRSHLDGAVAEQSVQRLGRFAILTAITVVGITIGQNLLQPELALVHQEPLFRLSALFLVLASIGLAALQRTNWLDPQALLDVGLIFEVCGAFALSAMDNSLKWSNGPVRGSAGVAAWIALCVLLIQNKPWKSCVAALLSALMVPCGHLVASYSLGYSPLPWNRLASYSLAPLFIAGWTPFISSRLHQMQRELSRTQELGNYHLQELLGRGGMGEVWRARHHLLRRDAAVKLVLPTLLSQMSWTDRRQVQQRFEQEAQAMASLRSPHTVALYDFGVSDEGSMYYVMELLDGMDLETLVKQYGPQPASRVVALIQQACESLEEAHESGLIHRDVKPGNLFVCRLGKRTDFVKVLDFGLVKVLHTPGQSQLTMHGETSGTPAFMAPEQVRGDSDIDARSDIYGLGAIAYYLLTGTLIFEGPTPLAIAIAQLESTPEPPSKRSETPIPTSLERVVMACLEKQRSNRPPSAGELARLLQMCTDIPRWTDEASDRWWNLHRPRPAVGKTA